MRPAGRILSAQSAVRFGELSEARRVATFVRVVQERELFVRLSDRRRVGPRRKAQDVPVGLKGPIHGARVGRQLGNCKVKSRKAVERCAHYGRRCAARGSRAEDLISLDEGRLLIGWGASCTLG